MLVNLTQEMTKDRNLYLSIPLCKEDNNSSIANIFIFALK